MKDKSRTNVLVSGVAGLLYLVVSWSSPEIYPFSQFPMYAQAVSFPVERLLVVDAEDVSRPLAEIPLLVCRFPEGKSQVDLKTLGVGQDGTAYHIPYLDREVLNRLEWVPALEDESLSFSLVRRRFFRSEEGNVTAMDTAVTPCQRRVP